MSNRIADLVSKGYGVFIDSGNDGLDEQNKPYTYHITVTLGEWPDLEIDIGTYGHNWEEALQELWEEVVCEDN